MQCGPAGHTREKCVHAAAARRAPLEFVEKLLTTNLTSTDTTERNPDMLRVPPGRIGRAGYWFRLSSQTAAWRGEVKPQPVRVGQLGPANNSPISACRAARVLAAQPTGSWGVQGGSSFAGTTDHVEEVAWHDNMP